MLVSLCPNCQQMHAVCATPEDLAADPAVQALIADAVRRERDEALREAGVLVVKAESWDAITNPPPLTDEQTERLRRLLAHHPTETDHG